MPRITQLPSLSTPDGADELAIVDASASVTKKITRTDFLSGAPLPNNTVTTASITDASVTTAKIADGAVTTAKIDFSTFGNRTQTFSGTSTVNVSLTGLPSGDYLVLASCRGTTISASADSYLSINLAGSNIGRAYRNAASIGNQINYFVQTYTSLTSASVLTLTTSSIPTVSDGRVTLIRVG